MRWCRGCGRAGGRGQTGVSRCPECVPTKALLTSDSMSCMISSMDELCPNSQKLRISSHSVWSGRSRLPPKSMRFLDLPCLAPTPSCATRDPVAGLRATCRCNSRISYCTFIFERLCKQCKFPVASRRGTSAARRPRTDYPGPGNTILAQRGKSECKVSAHSIIKILKPDGEPDTVLLLTLCSI